MSKNLVRIPAKNLNDLMVKARENGAVGITAYPDNHVKNSGESWAWGYTSLTLRVQQHIWETPGLFTFVQIWYRAAGLPRETAL